MDHLRRELAPISPEAWAQIEREATRSIRHFLAGRPLVDVDGPRGWDHSAHNLGRVASVSPGVDGVLGMQRTVLPLVEVRTPFSLDRAELDAVDRGTGNPDLDPVKEAARRAAAAEDAAVFYGWAAAGIEGVAQKAIDGPLHISDDYDDYPRTVAQAVAALRRNGVAGPYGIALGPRCYTGVIESTEHGGYPVLEHIRLILGGPIIWAPAVDGAVVVSLRGGDYTLELGQDFSIGYLDHDASSVQLYLEESFTFQVLEPGAAIALVYPE